MKKLITILALAVCFTSCITLRTERSRYAAADIALSTVTVTCTNLIKSKVITDKDVAKRILFFVKEGDRYLDLWSDALLNKLDGSKYERLAAESLKSLELIEKEYNER